MKTKAHKRYCKEDKTEDDKDIDVLLSGSIKQVLDKTKRN